MKKPTKKEQPVNKEEWEESFREMLDRHARGCHVGMETPYTQVGTVIKWISQKKKEWEHEAFKKGQMRSVNLKGKRNDIMVK